MQKQQIEQIIDDWAEEDGLIDTGIAGVKLFRATTAIPCAPAVYEPCVIAIVRGAKEAVLDGQPFIYNSDRYMCCPISMPVKAGTPASSPDNPLLGVYIPLDHRVMTELTIEMDNAGGSQRTSSMASHTKHDRLGIKLAEWDDGFTDALLRLLQLKEKPADRAILGKTRLRELYYAILKGEAGMFARQALGGGNAIARSIAHLSSGVNEDMSIDDMASYAGMSRAVFHRKFKQATRMSPIQFVKSMRLNDAAVKIAEGMTVNEAAMDVGYVSPSQFSREFKRMYGKSPRQWSDTQQVPMRMT